MFSFPVFNLPDPFHFLIMLSHNNATDGIRKSSMSNKEIPDNVYDLLREFFLTAQGVKPWKVTLVLLR